MSNYNKRIETLNNEAIGIVSSLMDKHYSLRDMEYILRYVEATLKFLVE